MAHWMLFLGVYYQAFMLAPAKWRRISSWICGWAYVVGNITITLAVNFGSALFFVACINVFEKKGPDGQALLDAQGSPIPIFAGKPYQVFLVFVAITLLCNAVSAFGNKWLPILDASPSLNFAQSSLLTHNPDCCHLLDIRWRHCHYDHHPRPRQGRPPQCQVGVYAF